MRIYPFAKIFCRAYFVAIAFLLFLGSCLAADMPGDSPSAVPLFPHSTLQILNSAGQSVSFNIEVATTPAQHSYGLMFRRSLPVQSGMLFLWSEAEPVSMWMKNTYIPLDMIFIGRDGIIVKIAANTVPFDLTPIPSERPVIGVIEINAGEAEKLGVRKGDRVLFSAFPFDQPGSDKKSE